MSKKIGAIMKKTQIHHLNQPPVDPRNFDLRTKPSQRNRGINDLHAFFKRTISLTLLAITSFALLACAQRPPNCSDADILAAALDNIIDSLDEDSPGLRDYKQKIKLTDIEVIQNKQTKANQVCLSKATINSPSGQKFDVKMAFQTVLEDGKIRRDIQAREGFLSGVDNDMWKYVNAQNKTANFASNPKTPEELRLQAMTYEQLTQEAKNAETTYGNIEQSLPASVRKDIHLDEMNFKANQFSVCNAAGEKAYRKGLPKSEYSLICVIQSLNERTNKLRALTIKEQPNETVTQVPQKATTEIAPMDVGNTKPDADTLVKEATQNTLGQKRPSFDCLKASTNSEKAICADATLSRLDFELAENYRGILRSNISEDTKTRLVATQRVWIAERNECVNNQCLADSYQIRTGVICDDPAISGSAYKCLRSEKSK
jgi:uncharacterized protein YecT (DUF1311 family)